MFPRVCAIRYESCLRFHTGSGATAAEIHAVGLKEVTRIGVEMRAACVACGMKEEGDGDVKAFLEALKTDPRFAPVSERAHVATYRGRHTHTQKNTARVGCACPPL
jgi:uncharacterized protein (DUF885 family)